MSQKENWSTLFAKEPVSLGSTECGILEEYFNRNNITSARSLLTQQNAIREALKEIYTAVLVEKYFVLIVGQLAMRVTEIETNIPPSTIHEGLSRGDNFHLDTMRIILCAAVSSRAVYEKSFDDIQRILESENRSFPLMISKMAPAIRKSNSDQTFLITESCDCIFVSFRGTDNKADILIDANVLQLPHFQGNVHRGFLTRCNQINLDSIADYCIIKQKKLIFCGHSLGGAVAMLSALSVMEKDYGYATEMELKELQVECVTFGAPAVGDKDLLDSVNFVKKRLNFVNFVNRNDPAPGVLNMFETAASIGQQFNEYALLVENASIFLDLIFPGVGLVTKNVCSGVQSFVQNLPSVLTTYGGVKKYVPFAPHVFIQESEKFTNIDSVEAVSQMLTSIHVTVQNAKYHSMDSYVQVLKSVLPRSKWVVEGLEDTFSVLRLDGFYVTKSVVEKNSTMAASYIKEKNSTQGTLLFEIQRVCPGIFISCLGTVLFTTSVFRNRLHRQ